MSLVNSALANRPLANRWVGLDWLRLFAMLAISWFHFYENVIWNDHVIFEKQASVLFEFIQVYSRTLSFSGFVIIALTSFLMAATGSLSRFKKRHVWLFALLCAGAFLVLPFYAGDGSYLLEWDIYHLLLFNFLLLLIFRQYSSYFFTLLGVAGFVLLWVPVWDAQLPAGLISTIFVGDCSLQKQSPWPLLPWSGLIWFSFSLGIAVRKYRNEISHFHKGEIIFLPFLFLGASQWGSYYSTPVGETFYCYMNRQSPFVFWGHFIWVLAFIRISLTASLNQYFLSSRILSSVSRLQWSQSFGLCYLVQLLVVFFFSQFDEFFKASATATALAMFSIIPVTEVLVRALKAGSRYTTDIGKLEKPS